MFFIFVLSNIILFQCRAPDLSHQASAFLNDNDSSQKKYKIIYANIPGIPKNAAILVILIKNLINLQENKR